MSLKISRGVLAGVHTTFLHLAVVCLAGCAFAPGVKFNSISPDTKNAPEISLQVKEITPQLLREEGAETRQPETVQQVQELFAQPSPYRIGIGDHLQIALLGSSGFSGGAISPGTIPSGAISPGDILLSGQVTEKAPENMPGNIYSVGEDGKAVLPYLGAIGLAGLTELEARQVLQQEFARYIKKPEVSVRVQSYRSKRIYVDGEVRMPGVRTVTDAPMTLPEVLAQAGGVTPMADQSAIQVSREGKSYRVNLPQLLAQGVNPAQIILRDQDMVVVSSRENNKVFVQGEVAKPAPMLMRNGQLTLGEALGEAGGVSPASGDPYQIYVVRGAVSEQPVIYHLDATSPVALVWADNFELHPKDVVFVDATALVRWNRVFSLLLPTVQEAYYLKNIGFVR